MDKLDIDEDRIDEAVLALMYLGLHADPFSGAPRSWKSFDWAATNRLNAKDLIDDPVGKAKWVVLTEEGRRRFEALFARMFVRRPSEA